MIQKLVFIYEMVTLLKQDKMHCARKRECYTGWAVCGQRLGCQGRAGAFQSNTPTSPRQCLELGHAQCVVMLWRDGRG